MTDPPATQPAPARDRPLLAYRTIAYVVGVLLPILLGGAIFGVLTHHHEPFLTEAGAPTVVKVIGPVHGFLYIGLLLFVLTLFFRDRWPIWFTLLVGLSGTIPFLSFVAERAVTRRVRRHRSAPPPARGAPDRRPGAATRPPSAR